MEATDNNNCAKPTKCKCYLPCKCATDKNASSNRAFISSQCISRPSSPTEKNVEVVTQRPQDKPQGPSQPSVNESDYNFPELSEIITLPITKENCKKITFAEILLIGFLEGSKQFSVNELLSVRDGKQTPIGGFTTSIKKEGVHYIILYNSSEFSYNGNSVQGTIYTLCDTSLNLIEEKRTDSFIDENGDKREKSIHLVMELSDDLDNSLNLVAFRSVIENSTVSKYHSKIKLNVTGSLIPDGLFLILLRYLVIQNFRGTFETWSITINGDICRSKCIFGMIKRVQVNCCYTECIQVIRYILHQNNKTEIINMHFMLTGHLLLHEWEESPTFIYINPLSPIPPTGFTLDTFGSWQGDIEMVSNYLDYKSKVESNLKTYLIDKPEARSMIKDYITLLLQVKPSNILGLTIEYFFNLHRETKKDVDDASSGKTTSYYTDDGETEGSEEEQDLEEHESSSEDELNQINLTYAT